VLRFQSFLDLLHARPDASLAHAAAEVGYADQAHLAHEVVDLTGLTPGRLRAGLMSDLYKTPAA
jgi:AraC-like DNA-binding protein